jgi:phosphatidylglycerophosphatase A
MAGYFPVASGTFGSLVGVALFLLVGGLSLKGYVLFLLFIILAGIWSAERCERIFSQRDSSKVVIDEVAGYLVAMTAMPKKISWIAAGFLLFRFFDIVKPPPARWIDQHVHGGWGIMVDDLIAGIYTGIILHTASRWITL